mmetsp:Transcript_27966/g.71466  ORF Transcript_27966/g.71466 Transcript_27966/m.71466 type:complete len:259 (+) Transcript_27966:2-778(+)
MDPTKLAAWNARQREVLAWHVNEPWKQATLRTLCNNAETFAELRRWRSSLSLSMPSSDRSTHTRIVASQGRSTVPFVPMNDAAEVETRRSESSYCSSTDGEDNEAIAEAAESPATILTGIPKLGLSLNLQQLKEAAVPPDECESKAEKLRRFSGVCSKIEDRVFLGSDVVARSLSILKAHGVTHVLNCAGVACPEYHPRVLKYMTLFLMDDPRQDIGLSCQSLLAVEATPYALPSVACPTALQPVHPLDYPLASLQGM